MYGCEIDVGSQRLHTSAGLKLEVGLRGGSAAFLES